MLLSEDEHEGKKQTMKVPSYSAISRLLTIYIPRLDLNIETVRLDWGRVEAPLHMDRRVIQM